MTDDELLDRLVQHDPDAEREFDDQFRPIIARMLSALRVPPFDADDLVQQVLIKALNPLREGKFRRDSTISTWLKRITLNAFIDYRRRLKRDRIEDSSADTLARIADSPRWPERAIVVRRALDRLRPQHAVVVTLLARGLTTAEIARVIKRSPGRTGGIMVEARHAFRAALQAEGFDPE